MLNKWVVWGEVSLEDWKNSKKVAEKE